MKENLLKFDLHLHTWYSDGKFSPKELLKKCKGLGLEVVAITDHESVKGVSEALAVGKKLGIKVIPGIELVGEWERIEYHILGYFIDYQSKKLENFIDKWRKAKEIQIKNMVKKLQDFGPRISFEEVLSQTKDYLAPSHILDAVFSFPDNLFLLQKKFGIKTQEEFFKEFLMDRIKTQDGKTQEGRAYVERKKPNIKEVLDLIVEINGISVWAHPFWKGQDIKEIEELAVNFKKFGLNGIETCYSFFYKNQTSSLHQIAQQLKMYESGGSDFHGKGIMKEIAEFKTYGIKINFPFDIAKKVNKER